MQSVVMMINEAQYVQAIELTTFLHCDYVTVSILQFVKSQVNTYKYVPWFYDSTGWQHYLHTFLL